MSLHSRKFTRKYLLRYIVYLSNIYVAGTGPFAKLNRVLQPSSWFAQHTSREKISTYIWYSVKE